MLTTAIDPRRGFISLEAYWRPAAGAQDPYHPGEKLTMTIYRPCAAEESCFCGSGRAFRNCCRNRQSWPVVTPNPGAMRFSQSQTHVSDYPIREVAKLRQALHGDSRLQCVVDGPGAEGFWLFVDNPPSENSYGRLNFGDLEITQSRLHVSTLSAKRHQAIQKLLTEIAGDFLGTAALKVEPPQFVKKPATANDRSPR